MCATVGSFYERDGVKLPRPNSSFYQVCWDGHNQRLVFYVGSMTFSYEPVKRRWRLVHDVSDRRQPPALLLWGRCATTRQRADHPLRRRLGRPRRTT